EGRELLAALHLAEQPDVRLDFIVRGEDGPWRFGASRYLVPEASEREAWARALLLHLHARFGGEEDRIKIEILRGVKEGEGDPPSAGGGGEG
ncbi:MAG: hypothetical protein HYU38_11690, partial [Candidatus Tectomicrobia bacterium]|nr:hypothetical protein [Candidatus Tectomicrobia bacterium]